MEGIATVDADKESDAAPTVSCVEDDEHDSKERVLLRYFLQEWELVKSILDRIVANAGISEPSDVAKIRSIVDKYQEQGQLLEPYLESIVCPFMLIVRTRIMQLGIDSDEVLGIIKPLCIIIYSLIIVCGYKSVIKFFPHQVSDLELAFALLDKCHGTYSVTSLRHESTGEMETKCVTLLWLYILVLIPFDISSVDTSVANSSNLNGSESSPLVLKILEISKDYLSNAGPMRRISGLLLSRLLTRPDMLMAFNSFIDWAHEVFLSVTDNVADYFKLIGVVEAVASIFKVGSRKVLLNVVSTVWTDISKLMMSTTATRSPLLRKFLVKLSQRIGLTCLPHRSPSWRYVGKKGSLVEHMLPNASGTVNSYNHSHSPGKCDALADSSYLEVEDMDIPETVEEIIELLLSGLKDSDTVVRWSAAKGVGRITACLTSVLSEDVLSSILELFNPSEGDGSWHGGCLALAELARRGLLLPASFPKVIPVIIKALHYDVRRGPHSIGSHVRDAAAYLCWAFGRAYSNTDMKGFLEQLAPHLLIVACYDREVNCRRAASAAFQENVGRQGSFPHGIEIVQSANYFSLASRANSYLCVALCIAQYKEYLYPFAEELLCYKTSHWDKSLRELAAEALSALAKYDHDHFAGHVLEKLLPCTLSLDLCMRHGATLASAELIVTLHKCGYQFPIDKQKTLASIVPAIEKARLYRGKGGEIMRSAVSKYIKCISLSNILLSGKTKQSLLVTINENLKHPNAQIQHVAVDALKQFVPAYLVASEVAVEMISKYLELLDDPNVAARRGSALALGVMPYGFLVVKWKVILSKLCSSCLIQHKPDDPDAEARVNAVRGLVAVCETLADASVGHYSEDDDPIYLFIKSEVVQSLFKALDDYAVDNRGDVGSWVREAAIDALERCTYILCKRDSMWLKRTSSLDQLTEQDGSDIAKEDPIYPLFDANTVTNLVGGIAKQAAEKLDKIREVAAKTLQRILYNNNISIPSIPHREMLEDIIPNTADLNWGVPTFSYPRLVQLLQFNAYSKFVLSGLVISVGGLQESLRKASMTALVEYVEAGMQAERNFREDILTADFLWILQHYQKCDRVITPTFKTIEVLLSKKVFFSKKDFGDAVLESLKLELKGSKDFTKLSIGLSILGYYACGLEATSYRALSHLLSFLGHRYPKIRKFAADQTYLVLLQNVNIITQDKMDLALEVLCETCWDGDVGEARRVRLQLYELAGLGSQTSSKVTSRELKKADMRDSVIDENETYSSLVDSSGF